MATSVSTLINAHRRAWIWCGLWSPSARYVYLYYIYAGLLFTLVLASQLSNWLSLVNAHSMLEINDIAMPPIVLMLTNIKTLEFLRNRRKFERIFGTIAELHAVLMPPANRLAERQLAHQCTMLSAIMCISCFSSLTAKYVWVLWQPQRTQMFVAVLPFDWEQCGAVLFYGTVTVQYAVAMYVSVVFSTLDVFGPSLYAMMCTFLALLGERLERMGHGTNVETECREELVECVRVHKLCLGLSAELEDIYSIHYTAQLGIGAFSICAVSYSITELNVTSDPAHTVHFIMSLVAMTTQILLPCYFGSVLTERSAALMRSVYASAWTERRASFRSLMRVFMERTKRPIVLRTYRGFFQINLPTYVMVMRMAYTLLSFCSQLM